MQDIIPRTFFFTTNSIARVYMYVCMYVGTQSRSASFSVSVAEASGPAINPLMSRRSSLSRPPGYD